MKILKIWNGRWDNGRKHAYIAAYTKKQAVEMARKLDKTFSMNELNQYWSPCWGTSMNGIDPIVGIWVGEKYTNNTPVKVV